MLLGASAAAQVSGTAQVRSMAEGSFGKGELPVRPGHRKTLPAIKAPDITRRAPMPPQTLTHIMTVLYLHRG